MKQYESMTRTLMFQYSPYCPVKNNRVEIWISSANIVDDKLFEIKHNNENVNVYTHPPSIPI